jgi:hypothetical protein
VAAEFTSWKEIANYLNVSVRTAQHWEAKQGLPVRRLPGGRGRVLAIAAELDAWKQSGPGPQNSTGSRVWWRSRWMLATIFALLLLGCAGVVAWVLLRPGVPAHWRIARDSFVVRDDRGVELWRHTFDRELSSFSTHPDLEANVVRIVDVDDDGAVEVLFGVRPSCTDCPGQQKVYCFSAAGAVKWTFDTGREVKTETGQVIPNSFAITSVVVGPLGRGGRKAVLVISVHNSEEFSQVCLLSPTGERTQEYWHAGHVGNMPDAVAIGDPGGAGSNLLFLSGISNPRRAATLVVLDPAAMSGASWEDAPRDRLEGFPTAKETVRIFFPRSRANLASGSLYNRGRQITLRAGFIGVETQENWANDNASINYSIKPSDFTVYQVGFADSFRMFQARLRTEGKIRQEFQESEESERLLQSIGRIRAPQ